MSMSTRTRRVPITDWTFDSLCARLPSSRTWRTVQRKKFGLLFPLFRQEWDARCYPLTHAQSQLMASRAQCLSGLGLTKSQVEMLMFTFWLAQTGRISG